jgi:hypothetical protein
MKDPTPECCKNCKSYTETTGCRQSHRDCYKWRTWFHKEWEAIQALFKDLKKNKETEKGAENEQREAD